MSKNTGKIGGKYCPLHTFIFTTRFLPSSYKNPKTPQEIKIATEWKSYIDKHWSRIIKILTDLTKLSETPEKDIPKEFSFDIGFELQFNKNIICTDNKKLIDSLITELRNIIIQNDKIHKYVIFWIGIYKKKIKRKQFYVPPIDSSDDEHEQEISSTKKKMRKIKQNY